MRPIIGYDNLMTSATVTASSEATGYEATGKDWWNPSTWWKPATATTHYLTLDCGVATTCSYFAIFSHDLGENSGTVKAQYSDDAITWHDLTTATTSTNGKPIMRIFETLTRRYYRLVFDMSTAACYVGAVAIGDYMEMERHVGTGFTPPHQDKKIKYLTNTSESGILMGRTIANRSYKLGAKFEYLTQRWVRDYLDPFSEHAETKPFFFSWEPEFYANEAVFCVLTKPIDTQYSHSAFMSAKIDGTAYYEL